MTWVLEASERGELVDRYPGGVERRNADIEAGAGRPAAEQIADVAATDAAPRRTRSPPTPAGTAVPGA